MSRLGPWLAAILHRHIERHNVEPEPPRFDLAPIVDQAWHDSETADAMRAELDRQLANALRPCWACGSPVGFHVVHRPCWNVTKEPAHKPSPWERYP